MKKATNEEMFVYLCAWVLVFASDMAISYELISTSGSAMPRVLIAMIGSVGLIVYLTPRVLRRIFRR